MPDEAQLEAVNEDDAKSVVFDSAASTPVDADSKTVSYVWAMPLTPLPAGTVTTGSFQPVVEKLAGPSVDESLIERLVAKHLRAFVTGLRGAKSEPLETAFKTVGNQWAAVYSNNLKDRDGEIFPAKAIDQYVARVDTGLVPQPELWVWHGGKQTRVGQADVVARHGHFVLAAGTWDDSAKAQTAREFYARHQKDTSLSHGFTYNKRAFDGVHYHDFNTFEISLLPRGVEANRYTTLEGVKQMAIDEKKKPYFVKIWGDKTDEVLQDLDGAGKSLEELGAEFKDFGHLDETPAVEAADDKAMGELMAELIGGQGESLKASVATLKAVKTLEARITAQDATIAALKEQLDDRPRTASTDKDTEMTLENMAAIVKNAKAQESTGKMGIFGWPIPAEGEE